MISRARQTRGLTLIELIVALSVLVVGTSSIFALFAVGAASHRRAVDMTTAARAAESVFAELEARWTIALQATRPAPAAKSGAKAPAGSKAKAPARSARDAEWPTPADAGPGPWPVAGFPNYEYTVGFEPVGDGDDAVVATVKITWQRKGTENSQEFRQVLLRRPF